MNPVRVRAATTDDHADLLAFIIAMAAESEGVSLDPATVSTGLERALADPTHRTYYIAESGQRAVGCCLVTAEWSDWQGTWCWWFQSVYVVPEARGGTRGVWRALYEHVGAFGLAAGVRKVRLYVHGENARAIRSYEKIGMNKTAYAVFEAEL